MISTRSFRPPRTAILSDKLDLVVRADIAARAYDARIKQVRATTATRFATC